MPITHCLQLHRIGRTRRGPLRHPPQLDAPDRGLHFRQSPVGAKAFMHPAKTGRMLALVNCLPALAVVFVRPHARPQLAVIGGDHAALAAGGHDLVLTETPGADMADATHRAPFVTRAMRLGAVLDHVQAALARQFHDGVHVAGHAGEVHADNHFGARGKDDGDAVRRDSYGNSQRRCRRPKGRDLLPCEPELPRRTGPVLHQRQQSSTFAYRQINA